MLGVPVDVPSLPLLGLSDENLEPLALEAVQTGEAELVVQLEKIESRPQRKWPLRVMDGCNNGSAKYFDYLFYVDFEASMADARAQNALGHLQEFATFMRVLGSYPMDVSSSD
ncbi:hypothetical protein SUGI_0329860 [Cryptomeria japonica]|nr:hypothetical protein SUGI_0329860 [Cryptomeria japonica]